jgi:transcriptional regulator with XRE-family HTH domain
MLPQLSPRLGGLHPKTTNRIRYYRLQLGLTQREVARRVGVRLATLSSWERGRTCPTTQLLLLLAKTLDTLAEALYPQFYLTVPPGGVTQPIP